MPLTKPTSLTEVIQQSIFSYLSDTYHILPGIVQAYYPATQTADVQIAVNDPRFDPDTDELSTEPWPIYPAVRVAWIRFGGFTITGPMAVGDKVTCLFADLDDSAYRTTGQQADPPRTRRHGSDGIFCLPFDVTDAGVATDGGTGGLVLGADGTQAEIRITPTIIQLGATGGDHVALAKIIDSFISVFTSTWTPVPMDGGAALKAAITAWVAAQSYTTVGSALIKAQ